VLSEVNPGGGGAYLQAFPDFASLNPGYKAENFTGSTRV
jgi:hypothetical protein